MAVKFIAHVSDDSLGNWFIELTDTLEESSVICKDMNDFKEKLQDMGSEYGNDIEVEWTKSKDLSPKSYQELNEQMAKLQEEYADEIAELNRQSEDYQGGFNPNA